ncbi:hypothetical protein Hokovirus_2_251 [Hokovirus HKV1]|uniref:FtsJ-like methyltransferase n=1 Tax=Hokovirus HKV1 TaxID=1977638 RepID=A0A1V0SGF5_9VIRU|nr:hypothetical protein Hokovirus_2_251 [Hokovirus HKV1]
MLEIYNDIFKQKIILDEKNIKIYENLLGKKINQHTKISELEWLPYVHSYANQNANIYFNKRQDMIEFIKNKKIVDNFMNKYRDRNILPLDLTSYIDFYKMYQENEPLEKRYKYIYLKNKEAYLHFPKLAASMQNMLSLNRILIPASNKIYTLNDTIKFGSFYVTNDIIEFITNNKNLENIDKGYIIYNLFFAAGNLSLLKKEEFAKNATTGLNTEELKLLLDIRKNNIQKYIRLLKGLDTNCEDQLLNFVNILGKIQNINDFLENYQYYFLEYDKLRRKLILCEDIQKLFLNEDDYDNIKDECNNTIFHKQDLIDYQYTDACEDFAKYIKTDIVKNNLLDYIKKQRKNTSNYKYDPNIQIEFFEEYMPEWYKFIENKQFEEAYKVRQTLLGENSKTTYLKYCSLMYRSDPFFPMSINLSYVSWDETVNKLVISCLLQKDIIFPIKLIGDIHVTRYKKTDITDADVLLFSYVKIIKQNNKTSLDHKLLYYNKIAKGFINTTNFRGLGTYNFDSEAFKVLYTEISLLYYFEQDQGIKLHYYRINTNNVLVSKYNFDEIYKKYIELGFTIEETDRILNKLEQVEIKRDHNKFFYFEEIKKTNQEGGKINLDDIKISYKSLQQQVIPLNKISTTFDIKFSLESKLFDKEIFPIKKYFKLLKKRKHLNNKMGDNFFLYENLGYFFGFLLPMQNYVHTHDKAHDSKYKLLTYRNLLNSNPENKKSLSFKNLTINNPKIKKIFDSIEKNNFSIVKYSPYTFMFSLSTFLNKYCNIGKNDNILILCKTAFMPRTMQLYDFKNMVICNYTYNIMNTFFEKSIDAFVEENKNVYKHSINESFDMKCIKSINEKIKDHNIPISVGLIDLWINHEKITSGRGTLCLQINLSCIYVVLSNLIIGGDLFIHYPYITNKLVYNFFIYIASLFENSKIISTYLHNSFSIILYYKSYLGNFDFDKFKEIIEKMYLYDASAGLNYQVTNTNEKYLLNIEDANVIHGNYLKSIVVCEESSDLLYYLYKQMITTVIKQYTQVLNNAYYIYKNREDKTIMKNIIKKNLKYSYKFAIANKFELDPNISFKPLESMWKIEHIINTMVNKTQGNIENQ